MSRRGLRDNREERGEQTISASKSKQAVVTNTAQVRRSRSPPFLHSIKESRRNPSSFPFPLLFLPMLLLPDPRTPLPIMPPFLLLQRTASAPSSTSRLPTRPRTFFFGTSASLSQIIASKPGI